MKNLVFYFIVLFSLLGCGGGRVGWLDPEYIKVYKCETASYYLDLNSDLMRKAVAWKRESITPPASRQEFLARIAAQESAIDDAMESSGRIKRKVLQGWYESDYCQSLLLDYQEHDFSESENREKVVIARNKEIKDALMRQIDFYSKSLVDQDVKEVSCARFKEQVDIAYENRSAFEYRGGLSLGLAATISDSLFKLREYQVKYVSDRISGGELESVAKSIYAACDDGALLSDVIGLVYGAENVKSPRTQWLAEKIRLNESDGDCGALSDVYCLAKLKMEAARRAYDVSEKCDLIGDQESVCQDGERMYEEMLASVELEVLNREKVRYERYIKNPYGREFSDDAVNKIIYLVNKCADESVSMGLRGEDYYIRREDVCVPRARSEYLKPWVSTLEMINSRINEVEQRRGR
ncbi:hypothetical protein CO615_02720 [Lysobacteraceae bacterium NML75-0749]|nr:hypothetical protein CO615_02720 [Xanthomonadaceae bacterium NML75-0749]PJK02706.1 hypothetical protein CO609_09560 [Xanthomonadaceae bacterium NML91-0268]